MLPQKNALPEIPEGQSYSRLVNQFPIFYGWVILVIGAFGLIMTSPGQTYALAIFIEHFITDLGLSRSLVSGLYSAASLVAGFTLPFIGQQIDRRGSRLMMGLLAFLCGLACIFTGFAMNAVWLGLGFFALRIFGQGGLMLVSTNVINQWWVRKRGVAMGIAGLLMSLLAVGGYPNMLNWLIAQFGWRTTFFLQSGILFFLLLPLALLLLRNYPEDYGLQPDGLSAADSRPKTSAETETSAPTEESWTAAEAVRTPVFWIVGLGIAAMAMAVTGLFFHMVSIFEDNGLSQTVTAAAFVPIAITTAIVTLSSGILIDRWPANILLSAALLCQTASLVLAPYLRTVEIAFLYGVLLGATFGLSRTVGSVIWADYFGRRHLGSITGITTTIMVTGASLGPLPFGIGRDLLGSYNVVLLIAAVFPMTLAGVVLFARKPEKPILKTVVS